MTHFTITHIAHTALIKPMPFKFIKAKGEEFLFQKGEANSEQKITFSNDFYLSTYLCTQEFWTEVLYAAGITKLSYSPSYFKGLILPVEQVSWDDIQLFNAALNKLNVAGNIKFLEGNIHLGLFTLPSEGQWEFAALAGFDCEFAGSNNLNDVGWYESNSNNKTHEIGLKQPNKNMLYDMSGNVWEWCQNDYGVFESNGEAGINIIGNEKVLRGGSCFNDAKLCRLKDRSFNQPGNRGYDIGFRLVFSPVQIP